MLFIGDIPRFQRSKLDSIFLVTVADHSLIDSDTDGKEELMKQVLILIVNTFFSYMVHEVAMYV
jgi:hypothetical protein